MHVEVSVALNFVISYMYNKLPRRRVDNFGEELERGIKNKFNGHWYPDQPFKGSGYRCIRVSGEKVDPVILKAAVDSGLAIEEVKEYLPKDLTVWIDPSEVSYRIGEKGVVKILYSDKQRDDLYCLQDSLDKEVQAANKTFNPDAQSFKPIDSLSSSLSNLSLSPSSPTPPQTWSSVSPTPALSNSSSPISAYGMRSSVAPVFTTAMFAQTKFGSTKLKTQAKRPARLSPTELTAFIKQRSSFTPGSLIPSLISPQAHSLHAARSRTLSPRELRDPRQEFLDHQMMLHHQHQQLQHQQQQQAGGFRPLSHSVGDLASFPDHILQTNTFNTSQTSNAASPETSKAFLDGLGVNTLSAPYPNLQHLLVAN